MRKGVARPVSSQRPIFQSPDLLHSSVQLLLEPRLEGDEELRGDPSFGEGA